MRARPDRTGYRVTYVGHATTLIEMGGVRLLTDPVLRQRLYHLRRRSVPIPDHLWAGLDAVLISHLHHDHLDLPSLHKLGPATRLIVPNGAGALLRKHGFQRVEEMRKGERTSVGGLTVTATHALHDGGRGPFGVSADTLGYIVGDRLVDGLPSIYFAGDTDVFPEMAEFAGAIDLALLPVWGWGPTLGVGHMNPERAAEACQLLSPRLAIPIHWGTLYPLALDHISPAFLTQPPQLFVQFMLRMAPQVEVRVLQPGQHYTASAAA
jgi:L-ascorbate metabolism protein UlaG (beta-lactamase superfamily)